MGHRLVQGADRVILSKDSPCVAKFARVHRLTRKTGSFESQLWW